MADPITFLAHFPAIQSAIQAGDDGMRIQLQIPESEMAQALYLMMMRDKVLRVTIEVDGGQSERTETPRRRAAKQRE
jgi:hypothetical protein